MTIDKSNGVWPKSDYSEYNNYDREDLIDLINSLKMQRDFATKAAKYNQDFHTNERRKGAIEKKKIFVKAFEYLINTYNHDSKLDNELKPGEHAKHVHDSLSECPSKFDLKPQQVPTVKTLTGWIKEYAIVPKKAKSKPGRPKKSK